MKKDRHPNLKSLTTLEKLASAQGRPDLAAVFSGAMGKELEQREVQVGKAVLRMVRLQTALSEIRRDELPEAMAVKITQMLYLTADAIRLLGASDFSAESLREPYDLISKITALQAEVFETSGSQSEELSK